TGEPTYHLLPPALYRGPLLPTKPFSPNVDTQVSGSITVDGKTTQIKGASGQQGHLFGSRHAERWAWAHCSDFEDENAVVHALTAQGRRGPVLTPFLTVIGVRWQGRWIRFMKVNRRSDFRTMGRWTVDVGNRRYRLSGRIEAPVRSLLRARYEDPDGSPRFCHNSEIASCRLALFERKAGGFEEAALLESRGTTHAEWSGRTPARIVEKEFIEVPV
ncbi:MAG TPA: tocopherol cyclase family protein, partial [Actinomycetota bacterium]|nr:tocopherol cyclase family protein [Actinomycetota bacterium]